MKNIKEWNGSIIKETKTHYKVYNKNGFQLLCLNDGTVIPMQTESKVTSLVKGVSTCQITVFVNMTDSIQLIDGELFLSGEKLIGIDSFIHIISDKIINSVIFTVECELINSVIK